MAYLWEIDLSPGRLIDPAIDRAEGILWIMRIPILAWGSGSQAPSAIAGVNRGTTLDARNG